MKSLSQTDKSRSKEQESLLVIDGDNKRCIQYSPIDLYPKKHYAFVPMDQLKNMKYATIRSDLTDCHIDICSIDVPALFTENFDYQDLRHDFVKGVLETVDLLGKTIYIQEIGFYFQSFYSLFTFLFI